MNKMKEALRDRGRRYRASLTKDEQTGGAQAIAARLMQLPAFVSAHTIMTYAPYANEISPEPALALRRQMWGEAGRRDLDEGAGSICVCYPRVIDEHTMNAYRCLSKDLTKGTYGIDEPPVGAPLIEGATLDLVLVPGLGFDTCGHRIGYGKGYYDRYLADLPRRIVTVGLTYDETFFTFIPYEAHDLAVDYVLTPTQSYDCR